MDRKKDRPVRRRPSKASAKPSKVVSALLGIGLVTVGFAALIVRLEVTQVGYRLSSLRAERRGLEDRNRRLRLEVAQLSSHERLHAIAVRDGLGPPPPGHVVVIP
jgi:cell division protein FtsL